ncbi:MAG: SDR family oxidoreductase, partial [Thermoflexales bacterium]
VSETTRQLGPIDLLINNAGMTGKADQGWELADDWWRVIEVNLRGPVLCARAVLPGMIARKRGRIINVSSNAGIRPTPPYSAYSVSKAALIRLTDSLAEVTQDQGICVFGISPGMVKTAMTRAMPIMDAKPEADWVAPELAAELCVFLASGQADRLSGRYVHVLDDIRELVRRADEIEANDLYALRMRKL